MKTTIKNLILSAVLVVGGASCVDLDTAPYDRETDLTYWEEDPEAAVKALNTCYTGSSSNLVVISFLFQLSSSFLILLKVVDMFAF